MPVWKEHELVCRLLRDQVGLIFQAQAQNPWGVKCRNIMPPDLAYCTLLRKQQEEMCGKSEKIDATFEAWNMPLVSGSEPFILFDHCFSRQPNVIGVLLECHRVLKPGGHLIILDPDPREVDEREPCPVQHHLEDYRLKKTWATHEPVPGQGTHGHLHTMRARDFADLFRLPELGGKFGALFLESPDKKIGNGWLIILRKVMPQGYSKP